MISKLYVTSRNRTVRSQPWTHLRMMHCSIADQHVWNFQQHISRHYIPQLRSVLTQHSSELRYVGVLPDPVSDTGSGNTPTGSPYFCRASKYFSGFRSRFSRDSEKTCSLQTSSKDRLENAHAFCLPIT